MDRMESEYKMSTVKFATKPEHELRSMRATTTKKHVSSSMINSSSLTRSSRSPVTSPAVPAVSSRAAVSSLSSSAVNRSRSVSSYLPSAAAPVRSAADSVRATTTRSGDALDRDSPRSRMLSEGAYKQHEETATIVTKVIREDTSEMEGKIRDLGTVTGELQGAIRTLLEQNQSDQAQVREKIEGFTSCSKEIKQAIHELSGQLNVATHEIQAISGDVQGCDKKIDNMDKAMNDKFDGVYQELQARDVAIDEIKQGLSHRDALIDEQCKQLRDLEETRHRLYHAEETLAARDRTIEDLNLDLKMLQEKVHKLETQTVHHIEVISALEREINEERNVRESREKELHTLHLTLQHLEKEYEKERAAGVEKDNALEHHRQTIEQLEETISIEVESKTKSNDALAELQQVLAELEEQLAQEHATRKETEQALAELQANYEQLSKERDELEKQGIQIRDQSQKDLDTLTLMLERLRVEKDSCEEAYKKEYRRGEQLQESMTNLRMILEEEQRKSEDQERQIQNFDRVIKETREMFALKETEFEMLKEEIVHYKNLVGTKEKELGNLTVAFNQNMSENKNEVNKLRQDLKEFKVELQEKEFRLREYRDREVLEKVTATSPPSQGRRSRNHSATDVRIHVQAVEHPDNTTTHTSTHQRTTSHYVGGSGATSTSLNTSTSSPACREPSPALGYCQTHRSIVSLDSRGSVSNIYQGKKSSRPIRICDDKQ